MLLDAIASAQASVGETKEKKSGAKGGAKADTLKASERRRNGSAASSTFASAIANNLYLDGVQPFVQYRRLLSLALMVRSLTDNPLLPTELFANPHRHYTVNVDIR